MNKKNAPLILRMPFDCRWGLNCGIYFKNIVSKTIQLFISLNQSAGMLAIFLDGHLLEKILNKILIYKAAAFFVTELFGRSCFTEWAFLWIKIAD